MQFFDRIGETKQNLVTPDISAATKAWNKQ
jgi:hypothetical protein